MRTSTLNSILFFGKEALGNRWQSLFKISISLMVLPQLWGLFQDIAGANAFASGLRNGLLAKGPLLEKLSSLFEKILQPMAFMHLLTGLLWIIGVLSIAQMSWDYFEDRPATIFAVVGRSFRQLLFKGLGIIFILIFLLTASALFSLLRVVIACLLVMLPVEIAANRRGGVRTALDTLFLKFAVATPLGRWPVFSNVMTLGGLAISFVFLAQIASAELSSTDVLLELNSSFWVKQAEFNGYSINIVHFIRHLLDLFSITFVVTIAMPFAAALRYVHQRPHIEVQA